MKLALICWLLLLGQLGHAQSAALVADSTAAPKATPLQAATVPAPGVAGTELYLRAKLWLLNNHSIGRYKWLGDRNTNLIAVRGEYYLPTIGFNGSWLYYSLKLLLSNGSYRYTVTDVYFRKNGLSTSETIPAEQLVAAAPARRADRRYQEALAQQISLLVNSLQSGMQQPITR